jgi:hypothetical protein
VEDAAEGTGRVVADQKPRLDPDRCERARLCVGMVDDAPAERPGVRNDDADLQNVLLRRRHVGEPWVFPRWTIPTFIGARLPASWEQETDDRAREQQLGFCRDTDTMPAASAVKELLSAQSQPWREVLQVGHRRRRAPEHGWIEHAAPCREQPERDEPAADLEAPVGNVLVRHVVTGDMKRRAEDERERARADERAGGGAHCDMERDDHATDDGVCSRAMSLGGWFTRLFSPSTSSAHAEDEAIEREEYGDAYPGIASEDVAPGSVVAGGVSGYAGLEDTEAVEGEQEELEPPADPAP